MNEIIKFENVEFGEVRVLILNGKEYFNLEDVCFKLGYVRKNSIGKEYLRKDRIEALATKLGIKGVSVLGTKIISITKQIIFNECYISEEDLYDFIFESECDNARKFRKWVTSEVLPAIRRDGGYISENATHEQVVKLVDKYSFRKITSEIANSNVMELESRIREMYDTNIQLKKKDRDKFHQKLNKTEYKVKLKEHIRFAIENRPMPIDGVQAALEAVVRYSIIDKLDKELLTTTRKSASAKLSYKDKCIDELKNKVEDLSPSLDKYLCVDYHALSNNRLYEGVGNNTKKTFQYSRWIKGFPNSQCITKDYWSEVDFTKPIKLYLKFVVADARIDPNNLCKATIDQIMNRVYNIDDNVVKETVCQLEGVCDVYKEGKIYFYITNI